MPHDVTMPQLGMAQDAGKIVSWLKAPGDAVAKGDALFEVETDKAVMEVEAQADGYLTAVSAAAGDDVTVGHVIARISDSAEGDAPAPAPSGDASEPSDTLPDGHPVTMPQLGMAQDSGLLVAWSKAPGDKVAANDVLFEVETDKSTMEVEAGRDGWLAATLAEAGQDVPVGVAVAILSDTEPTAPVARALANGRSDAAPEPALMKQAALKPPAKPKPAPPASKAPAVSGGRILASPKARRLALDQGLDLSRLVAAGHPQPYRVADLDVLRALPQTAPSAAAPDAARRLTAACTDDGLAAFSTWAFDAVGLQDEGALLAGLAGASLGSDAPVVIAIRGAGGTRTYTVPPGRSLSAVTDADTEDAPALIVRDLRRSRVTEVAMGAEPVPVLTLTGDATGITTTLECRASAMEADAAIMLLSEFAGRIDQPLRHLL
jgi:pyruvate dehydrogenase E2 component (dihydrolipoamide acetyltransferase)/2-oxoglutarate dehydrogenase E2 component (dihydrolipoamide succinyltransferase)